MPRQLKFAASGAMRVTVEGSEVCAATPEGQEAKLPLTDLLERVAPRRLDTIDWVLPDGVKCVKPTPGGLVVVHQTPPRVFNLRWIAKDSPSRWGEGTQYRDARVALPYLVVLAVFENTRRGVPELSGRNECYFSNDPVDTRGLDTPLAFPALLNCSRFPQDRRAPLAWVCTQYLEPGRTRNRPDLPSSVSAGLRALLHHLMETGFNFSSEDHELSSWYSETVKAKVDDRVATIEAWERATADDPLFPLEIAWLPTGHTLGEIVARIERIHAAERRAITSADDLARVVFQAQSPRRRR